MYVIVCNMELHAYVRIREKTDQELELIRLQREVRDASNRLQAMHTKCSTAEKVRILEYMQVRWQCYCYIICRLLLIMYRILKS